MSAEAVAARMSEISMGAATLTLSEDLERTPSERANMLYSFVKKHISAGTIKTVQYRVIVNKTSSVKGCFNWRMLLALSCL